MGRHQGRTEEPERRGMPPTPAKCLEAGKTRVRRALLCGASSALPFLSLPGPAWWLLQSHCIFLLLHRSPPFPLLHPAWPRHRAYHVCCGKWQVSPMAMTTSWGWRSRRRGTSGISLISLTLLLMQLTSLLLLLSSGLGPKIQSGGGKSTKQAAGYVWLFPESKLAGKSLPPTTSCPSLWVFTIPPLPLQSPWVLWYWGLCSSQLQAGFQAACFWKPSWLRQMKSHC